MSILWLEYKQLQIVLCLCTYVLSTYESIHQTIIILIIYFYLYMNYIKVVRLNLIVSQHSQTHPKANLESKLSKLT